MSEFDFLEREWSAVHDAAAKAEAAVLEQVRGRLRNLLRLIDRVSRKPLYTDFEDAVRWYSSRNQRRWSLRSLAPSDLYRSAGGAGTEGLRNKEIIARPR